MSQALKLCLDQKEETPWTDTVEETLCKGLVYRARVNTFINSNGDIVHKQSLVLAHRKSCSGCPDCSWYFDDIKENISSGILVFPAVLEDKAYYTPTITDVSRDWESGHIDDYDITFTKIEL